MQHVAFLSRLRHWLNNIPIQDPIERRIASLLQATLIGLIVVIMLATILSVMNSTDSVQEKLNGITGNFLGFLVVALPLILLRRGYFRASALIIITILIITPTLAITVVFDLLNNGGILFQFTLAIILAGLLVSRSALALTFGLSAAVVGFAASRGQNTASQLAIATNFILFNGLIALFVDRFGITLQTALTDALTRERELKMEVAERKQAEEKIERQNQRFKVLREIDIAILAADSLGEIVHAALAHVRALIGCQRANLTLIDWERNTSVIFDMSAIDESSIPIGREFPLAQSQEVIPAFSQNQLLVMDDLRALEAPGPEIQDLIRDGLRSLCSLPLSSQGNLVGRFNMYAELPGFFDEEKIDLGREIANQIAIAISQNNLLRDLRTLNDELEQRVTQRTAELHQLNLELKHANRAKDEFLASMSHELRTPLNTILGMSETLLEQTRGPLNDKQTLAVQLISSGGVHLLHVINDILELSKIEAGKLTLRPALISLKETCESSLNFVAEMAVKKSISLGYKSQPGISKLYADPQRLKQILVNLLSNAVKFTPDRGKVSLDVHADVEKGQIQFMVTDSGIGIEHHDLKKLFTPFTQLDSGLSRQYAGTGLGLVLVYKFTELHGGSVHVESEVGKGSRFTVVLPWSPDRTTEQNKSESLSTVREAIQKTAPSSGEQAVILLAEDHESNVPVVRDYLQEYGYRIIVAQNGVDALEKAEKAFPSLILMDIQMPEMDGLEAIRLLRANPRFASTPIIALTALAMPGDREHCLAVGANEYLSKPVSLKMLVQTIRRLLDPSNE
jgi:signal transduction histidine kinase/ActR/RegA family two-component response regulator